MNYQYLIVEVQERVGLITLNRPEAHNALCEGLMDELVCALDRLEASQDIGAIVLTGNEKAFAAGADIKAMANLGFSDAYAMDLITANWERVSRCRKPVIAAVAGYALGGGCELAMMCDFIIAADNANFGQPEVLIGTIPGAGGTQRLTRVIGKSKAMEMIMTGRTMGAVEAEQCGLVSRVVPLTALRDEVMRTASKIASLSAPILMLAKEAVDRAYETPLSEGIRFERRMLHASFATNDQKEGMAAFIEKREPVFTHG